MACWHTRSGNGDVRPGGTQLERNGTSEQRHLVLASIYANRSGGADEWTEQWTEGNVVGIYSVHVRYAIELCAIGALNILASVVLLLRRSGWVWWLVIGMQVGILVLAEIEAQVIDAMAPGWFVFSYFPLLSLFLLFAFRMAQGRVKPPIDRNLTPHLTP